jgi:hypothetical protein
VAIATISSANYWPYTAVMVASVLERCPGWKVFILALDDLPAAARTSGAVVLDARELWGDETDACRARFTLFEWACASKPRLLRHLLDHAGAKTAIYADSDLEFFSQPQSLGTEGWSVLLQPNVCNVAECESASWERLHLMYGVFNGGFLATRDTVTARAFLNWWDEKVVRYCCAEPTLDVFSDQRWLDMAPGLFPEVLVDRDLSCNVAVWNVCGRDVAFRGDRCFAGGKPLSFFHYHRVRLGIDVAAYVAGVGGHPAVDRLVRSYLSRAEAHASEIRNTLQAAAPAQVHPLVHKAVRDALAEGELAPRSWPNAGGIPAELRRLSFDDSAVRARVRLLAYNWPAARDIVTPAAQLQRYRNSRLYRAWIGTWFFLFAPRALPIARDWTFRSSPALFLARGTAALLRRGRAALRPSRSRT